jgi:hypothetical protein
MSRKDDIVRNVTPGITAFMSSDKRGHFCKTVGGVHGYFFERSGLPLQYWLAIYDCGNRCFGKSHGIKQFFPVYRAFIFAIWVDFEDNSPTFLQPHYCTWR